MRGEQSEEKKSKAKISRVDRVRCDQMKRVESLEQVRSAQCDFCEKESVEMEETVRNCGYERL